MTRTPGRPGLTLTEALVALFVAALGLISLLVLFPLGALQMSQALKDERTAQTAAKADGLLRWWWQTDVLEPLQPDPRTGGRPQIGCPDIAQVLPNNYPNRGLFGLGADPLILALDDPSHQPITLPNPPGPPAVVPNPFAVIPQLPLDTGFPPAVPPALNVPVAPVFGRHAGPRPLGWPPTVPTLTVSTNPFIYTSQRTAPGSQFANNGPSYPVFLDGIGWQARNASPADQAWLAGRAAPADRVYPLIPRRPARPTYYSREMFGVPLFGPPLNSPAGQSNAVYSYGPGVVPNAGGGTNSGVAYAAFSGLGPMRLARPHPLVQTAPVPTLPGFEVGMPGYSPLSFHVLQDDLTYDESGVAIGPTGANIGGVERLGRYSWGAMLQRAENGVQTSVNVTVLAFENRPPGFPTPNSELMYPRDGVPTQPVVMTVGGVSVQIPYQPALGPPPVSKGRWILDGTIYDPNQAPSYNAPFTPAASPALFPLQHIRNANFYRVVSVTDDGAGLLTVELQSPVLQPLGTTLGPGATYPGQIYVLQNLSEVFVRPPLAAPVGPPPGL